MERNELSPTFPGSLVPDYADEENYYLNNTGSGTQIGKVNGNYVVNLQINNKEDKEALTKLLDLGKKNKCTISELATMRNDKFNVFVIEHENFRDGTFTLPKSACLKKHMAREDVKLYQKASSGELLALRKYPCLFATRNVEFTKTTEQHMALLGKITDIECQKGVIKFTFAVCLEIKQNLLNTNAKYLGLFSRETRNELDDSGWSLKEGDLLGKLKTIGIDLR